MSTFIVTWYEGGSFAMNPTTCGTTKIKCADLTAAITKASSILSGKLKTEKAPDNACGFYVKVQICEVDREYLSDVKKANDALDKSVIESDTIRIVGREAYQAAITAALDAWEQRGKEYESRDS